MKKSTKKSIFLAVACVAAVTAATAFAACEKKEHAHEWGEWEVTTAATCTAAGEETRVCKADSSHKETRTLNAKGHGTLAKTDEKPATCTENGAEAYWTCPDCQQKFGDAEGATAITAPAVIPAAHGTLVKTDENPATCTGNGTEAYWTCPDCQQKFGDAEGATAITSPAIIPAAHGTLFHHEAVTATCGSKGVQEYWVCLSCYQKFNDAEGEVEISDEQLQTTPPDPTAHGTLERRVRIDATCTSDGTEEYWYCPGCLKNYSDAEGTAAITAPAVIPAAHGTLIKEEAAEATCVKEGAEAYWRCEDCGQKFSDANGAQKISKSVPVAKKPHTPGSVISGTTGGSVTLPSGTTITQQNNDYYECGACNKKFADSACTKEITNPGKYATRGGTVLAAENNLMFSTAAAAVYNVYFKAEEAGCYVFILDKCTFVRMSYFAEAGDGNNGISVYSNGWSASSKYINRFGKNDTENNLGGVVYIDMNEGEAVYIVLGGITANTVFGADVEKTEIAENENNLFIGANSVTVNEADVSEGVEWVFTAPADDFYKISVPENSLAYVMKETDGVKTVVLSAPEEKLSYVFKAAKGETFVFYTSADTMGDVEFPVTYSVTVENKVKFNEIVIDAAAVKVTMQGGESEYEFIVEVAAGNEGAYILQLTPTPGTMRNYYDIYVNDAKIGQMQSSEENRQDGIWKLEIQLAAGVNMVKIKNASSMNGSGGASIAVVTKA